MLQSNIAGNNIISDFFLRWWRQSLFKLIVLLFSFSYLSFFSLIDSEQHCIADNGNCDDCESGPSFVNEWERGLCRHFVDDKEDDDDRKDCDDCDDDDEKCDNDEKMTMTMMIGVRCLAAPPSDPLSSPWSTDDTSFHHQDCSLLSSRKYTNNSSNKTTIIPNTNITTRIIKPTFQPLKHYHHIHQNQFTIIAFYQKSLQQSPMYTVSANWDFGQLA